MKILLGVFRKDINYYVVQDNGIVLTETDPADTYLPNYASVKLRDMMINSDQSVKDGDGVFDFRYGPVTSGVGEAGIYHLYTYGERILSVSIDLSYKHRNIQNRMVGLDLKSGLKMAESICGNFAFSHSLAFSKAVESAIGVNVDSKSQRLRIIALELERIYNHLYVIYQLAQTASQKVLTSHLSYLFEESLRLNKKISGSRYLKNFNDIGGIKNFDEKTLQDLKTDVQKIVNEFKDLYEWALESGNFLDRLYSTAILKSSDAMSLGITGPTLRASGIREDLRYNDPAYENLNIPIKEEGDALSRMEVRAEEIFESQRIIFNQIENFDAEINAETTEKGFGYCESPSGTMVYKIDLESQNISDVYIATPSLFAFKGIANSLVGNIFTDFQFAVESFGVNFADAAL